MVALNDIYYNMIPISNLNPLAKGHKINHPPPDMRANVKFIDFDIPYTFYPTDFIRYLPFINAIGVTNLNKYHKNKIRGVAIVSTCEINHNEELYVDYLEEEMTPGSYKPDWLLSTPERETFLIKREYMYKPNYIDKVMNKIYLLTYGQENEDINNTLRTYNKLITQATDKPFIKQIK
jgi:hypothetical protein